jgi:dsDNA-specific endonuclease/ATPase MutS2|tara:strand:- start:505 stop:729 length:225 start_codon:yes stop_codon:yes gene_type:complete
MKTTEELKMKRGKLTEAEVKSLNSIKAGIEIIEKDPNVSIMGLREIQNIYSTIRVLKESYTERVINLLKEGNKL